MGEILLMSFTLISIGYTVAFVWAWFDFQEKERERRRPKKLRK